jgi:hypothetical protein
MPSQFSFKSIKQLIQQLIKQVNQQLNSGTNMQASGTNMTMLLKIMQCYCTMNRDNQIEPHKASQPNMLLNIVVVVLH